MNKCTDCIYYDSCEHWSKSANVSCTRFCNSKNTEYLELFINRAELFELLVKRAEYALNSHSINLVYEVYGMSKMARDLKAITKEQFSKLNEMLVRNGINNPQAKLE